MLVWKDNIKFLRDHQINNGIWELKSYRDSYDFFIYKNLSQLQLYQ